MIIGGLSLIEEWMLNMYTLYSFIWRWSSNMFVIAAAAFILGLQVCPLNIFAIAENGARR